MSQGIGVFIIFGLLILSVWSIARPAWAFALVNLMFPIKQVLQGFFPGLVVYGPHLSAAIAVIAALAVFYKSTQKRLTVSTYFNPVTWCTLVIYFMITFGLIITPARESALNMYKDAIPYIVVFLFIYPFLLSDLNELRQGIFVTVMLGCVTILAFFLNPSAQWAGGRLIVNLGQEYGVSEFTSNPLALADTGGFMMIAAMLMNFKDKGRLGILFTVAGLVLGLGLAIVSGSRGQIIFAVFVSILMYPVARRIRDTKQFFFVALSAGFMLLVIALTFSFFLEGEAARRWTFNLVEEGTSDRSERVMDAIRFYIANPAGWLMGNGTNSFAYFVGHLFDYPHNIVAEMLLDYGLVGFGLFLGALWCTFKYSRAMVKIWGEDPVDRGTVAAWIGICLFALLVSFKQGSVIGQPTPFYFWIILAKIYFDELKAARTREYAAQLEAESAWGSGAYDPALEYREESYGRA
ncbi:MAG: O-antigen ligase family protein [Phycisphaeraceae bacterium]|nr:O-antigen ligase family protein [Phycisphaeraceae bacterium]